MLGVYVTEVGIADASAKQPEPNPDMHVPWTCSAQQLAEHWASATASPQELLLSSFLLMVSFQ